MPTSDLHTGTETQMCTHTDENTHACIDNHCIYMHKNLVLDSMWPYLLAQKQNNLVVVRLRMALIGSYI